MADDARSPIDLRALVARDRFASELGIEYVDGPPGPVVLRLAVRDQHCNFAGACHGAVIFAIADSAFGLACNADGMLTPALDALVTYTAPVWPGDVIEATAREIARTKRITTFRADVRRGGDIVAAFTATAYRTDRRLDGTD